jgi:hypothetical protein
MRTGAVVTIDTSPAFPLLQAIGCARPRARAEPLRNPFQGHRRLLPRAPRHLRFLAVPFATTLPFGLRPTPPPEFASRSSRSIDPVKQPFHPDRLLDADAEKVENPVVPPGRMKNRRLPSRRTEGASSAVGAASSVRGGYRHGEIRVRAGFGVDIRRLAANAAFGEIIRYVAPGARGEFSGGVLSMNRSICLASYKEVFGRYFFRDFEQMPVNIG